MNEEIEKRPLSAEDIAFLSALRDELATQEHDCEAAPRYWTIMESRNEACWEEEADDHELIFEGEEVSLEEALHDAIDRDALAAWLKDDFEEWEDDLRGFEASVSGEDGHYEVEIVIRDEHEAMDWLRYQNNQFDLVPVHRATHVVHGTFFLTKREAREYIENQRHNLAKDPHTYAMTANDAPQVKRLWEILESVDWESVGVAEISDCDVLATREKCTVCVEDYGERCDRPLCPDDHKPIEVD